MALSKTDGRLWTWERNYWGETGAISPFYDPIHKLTLILASELDGASVVFVSCGFDFSMLVTSDGVLWSCGNNMSNECGFGDVVGDTLIFERVGGAEYFGPGGVCMISCGFSHSMIIAKNNSVWSSGSNDYGTR
jgi:alpha-tubulin suppressor-like RCC1 family protein